MKCIASFTVLWCVLPTALFAQSPVTISFNEYPIGTVLSDQYADVGCPSRKPKSVEILDACIWP